MIAKESIVIDGIHDKPILIDFRFIPSGLAKPIIIFCHGYKGFKDWGAWNIMANDFANAGFCFVKFNFSHNGGTVQQPIDFPDLEAFGNNNYTKELDDLSSVIDWVCGYSKLQKEGDLNNIILLGHSRGGGIASIKAQEDSRIKKLISLAGVSDFRARFHIGTSEFDDWKSTGIKYVENSRTKQHMPHYFQFYKDFIKNEDRLTIERAVKNLKIPHLILHGDSDTSILLEEAKNLHKWNPNSKLEVIEGANHVFGTSHPWDKNTVSHHLNQAISKAIKFISNT